MPPDCLQVARELIAIESITGNEEPAVRYLEARLREMGLPVRSETVAPGRRNLIAGPEQPSVLFCTHTDTVPPFLEPGEDEEHLYGRGACDTKGITACFIEAGRRLLEGGFDDFGYLFVAGEEVDNIGAKAANRSVRARHVVLGEPTENRLAVGHKGCVVVRAVARGVACHSAYPEEGDSALHRLLRGLGRVLETDFGGDPTLGPATVNIGTVEGGVAANVLAPAAEARIALRVVGPLDEAERRLAACFADPRTGKRDEKIELETVTRMPVPRLSRVDGLGLEETVVAYGTDAPFLGDVGEICLIGPGSIRDAHTARERISKRAMEEAVGIYVRLARRLAGG